MGGFTGIKGEATGFFHVEEIDGRNWFITPEGNAFFAVALSHTDVVCVQAYGPWEKDRKLTDSIYEATGKPIFNGDGCFGLAGPNQQEWGVKGFRTGAKSIDEVASLYEEMLRGMMATPYCIGWHHCG